MKRIGIDLQSVFGMPPHQHATLAAELGCGHISIAAQPVPWQLPCFKPWSLREDKTLYQRLIDTLHDHDIEISQAEGFAIRKEGNVDTYLHDLDLMASLGARAVSTVCLDTNLERGFEQFSLLSTFTSERELELRLEFAPPHPVNSLYKALEFIRHLDTSNTKIVLDSMHYFRCGLTVDDLLKLNAEAIGYVQLSDAMMTPQFDDYFKEACFYRLPPGDGELPLDSFIQAIPDGINIGLEIPCANRARSYAEIKQFLTVAVARTKNSLDDRT